VVQRARFAELYSFLIIAETSSPATPESQENASELTPELIELALTRRPLSKSQRAALGAVVAAALVR
jgi:hypothetical protein